MYCPKCGKELGEEDKEYCSLCGTKVNDNSFYNDSCGKYVKRKQSEVALASMISGILSIVFPFLLGIPLSIIALVLAKKGKESEYARVGKITGIIGLVLSLITLFIVIAYVIVVSVFLYRGIDRIPGIQFLF